MNHPTIRVPSPRRPMPKHQHRRRSPCCASEAVRWMLAEDEWVFLTDREWEALRALVTPKIASLVEEAAPYLEAAAARSVRPGHDRTPQMILRDLRWSVRG